MVGAQAGEIVVAGHIRARLAATGMRSACGKRAEQWFWIHQAMRIRLDVAPCAEQAERKPRFEHHAAKREAPTPRRRYREHRVDRRVAANVHDDLRARAEVAREDRRPVEARLVLE